MLALACAVPMWAGGAAERAMPLPSIFSDITAGGAELCVVDVPHAPVVAVRVYLPGGTMAEDRQTGSGLACAAFNMLRDAMQSGVLCSTNSACPGRADVALECDGLCVSLLTTRERLGDGLRALMDVVCATNLADAAWRRVRERVANQMTRDERDPPCRIRALYQRAANAWNPLSAPARGELQQFLATTPADLRAYCDRVRASGNVRIVIAGAIDSAAVAAQAADACACLPHGNALSWTSYDEPVHTGARRIEQRAGVTQSWVCVGFSLGREGEETTPATDVLLQLLRRSREPLAATVRRTAPSVGPIEMAEEPAPRGRRSLLVSCQVNPSQAELCARALADWFHDSANFIWPEDAVRDETGAMYVRFLNMMDDPEAVARMAGGALVRTRNPQYPVLRAAAWRSVAPADIGRAALACFQPARTITALLAPRDAGSAPGMASGILAGERALLDATQYPPRRMVLGNGAVLVLRRNPKSPVVRFVVGAIGGVWCEQAVNNGVFALLGEAMRGGTKTMQDDRFAAACRDAGLMLHADTWPQHIALSGVAPPEGALDAARLLCASWAEPCLTEESIRAAAAALAARQAAQHLDTPAFADTLFRTALFVEQPYRMNTLGALPITSGIAARDLARMHGDFISPRATTLVVEGDFDEVAMEQTVRTAWRKYAEQPKSEKFYHSSYAFELRSSPPSLVVCLPPEPAVTGAVTRLFASPLPTTLLVCGVRVPSCEETNYPPHMAQLVRGALLHQLDQMKTTWLDEDEMPLVREGGAAARDWYGVAWAYLCVRVPPQAAAEGLARLQAAVRTALHGLADGSLLATARSRAVLEHRLDGRFTGALLEDMLFDELFGRAQRLPGPLDGYLDRCTPEACARMVDEHGAHTVTVIASPTL